MSPKKQGFFAKIFQSRFLKGAAILAVAGILCRLIGVVIRIPLTNIVGNYGMGIYQMVFPLYSLLLIISSAGVPVAISKMVAHEKVGGDIRQCRRILLNSVVLLGAIGAVVTALFMIFSIPIAHFQGNRDAWVIYLAIAPSVFLVCVIAAFRGYFQGLQNMIPTATSQVIEQTVKLIVALTLAVILIKISVIWAVFGAILAVTASEIIALVFLVTVYVVHTKKTRATKTAQTDATKNKKRTISFSLMRDIFRQSLPVTLMSAVFPLILVVDSLFIIRALSHTGIDITEATKLFGISSGAVHTLINLPAVIGAAVATAIVPAVSALLKQNKIREMRQKMSLAIKITICFSVFFAVVYLLFPRQILDLLYHNAFKDSTEHMLLATRLMRIESALIILIALSSVFTAMLQGAGRAKYPLIALLIGGGAKIAFQFAFIWTPLGIYAVSIGNVICFAIAACVNLCFTIKYFGNIKDV